MTTVYWNTPTRLYGVDGFKGDVDAMTMAYFEPEPVFQHIVNTRDTTSDNHYSKCPAFIDYYKNTYVIRSPVDLKLIYDESKNFLSIAPQDQGFYDRFIFHRGSFVGKDDPFLMSLFFYYMFIADKECGIEMLPVTFHDKSFANKVNLIQGTFDISKWYRPLEIAFELVDPSQPISIKRGDPLYYVRFTPKDNKKIHLVKENFSEDVMTSHNRCVSLKLVLPKQSLPTLYEIAKKYLAPVKKCPFNWRNK